MMQHRFILIAFCLAATIYVALFHRDALGWLAGGGILGGMLAAGIMPGFAYERFRRTQEARRTCMHNLETVRGQLTVCETQSVKTKAALEIKINRLLRANQANNQFLAIMSHDLRQPLSALNFFTETLRVQLSSPEERATLDNIQQVTQTISQALDNLLDISRIDAERLTPARRLFPLHQVMQRVVEEFQPVAAVRGLRLEFPPAPWQEAIALHSDPRLFERILRELVSNAIHFTEQGRISLDCNLLSAARAVAQGLPEQAYMCISVTDTGAGIPAGEQNKVFDPFYRLKTANPSQIPGLGLGLTLVKRAADLLNHRLYLESTVGEGSRISLYIPMQFIPTAEAAPSIRPAPETPQNVDILLVEDDETGGRTVSRLLTSWGYHVVYVATLEAVNRQVTVEGFRPGLVVSDYRLGEDETGLQVILNLRARLQAPQLPAILMTGDSDPALHRQAETHGCELLLKPAKPAHLRKLINYCLRRSL